MHTRANSIQAVPTAVNQIADNPNLRSKDTPTISSQHTGLGVANICIFHKERRHQKKSATDRDGHTHNAEKTTHAVWTHIQNGGDAIRVPVRSLLHPKCSGEINYYRVDSSG